MTPVPIIVAVVVPPGFALTVSVTVCMPADCGTKMIWNVQLAPGAKVAGQLLTGTPPNAPGNETPNGVVVPDVSVPLLVTVKVMGALLDPTAVFGKVAVVGEIDS